MVGGIGERSNQHGWRNLGLRGRTKSDLKIQPGQVKKISDKWQGELYDGNCMDYQ